MSLLPLHLDPVRSWPHIQTSPEEKRLLCGLMSTREPPGSLQHWEESCIPGKESAVSQRESGRWLGSPPHFLGLSSLTFRTGSRLPGFAGAERV